LYYFWLLTRGSEGLTDTDKISVGVLIKISRFVTPAY